MLHACGAFIINSFITGLLGSVHNLTVTLINSTTVLISWSPPFTLEGVPILGYNVTVMNETVLLERDTTMLYYSIDHSNSMHFTVVPINQVGAGQIADITCKMPCMQLQ